MGLAAQLLSGFLFLNGLFAQCCFSCEVRKELPEVHGKARAMHKTSPLAIAAHVKMTELSGFKVRVFYRKAGVWSAFQCETSLAVNAIYEATGVALWLQTGVFSSHELPREDVNWQSLLRFMESFFSKRALFKTNVTRSTGKGEGVKKMKGERSRLIWPCAKVCKVDSVKQASAEHFDAQLPLLCSGQFVLWSWFLALFDALTSNESYPGHVIREDLTTYPPVLFVVFLRRGGEDATLPLA